MGQPSKYSKLRAAAILNLLKTGATRTASAVAAGIHRETLKNWIAAMPAFAAAVEQAEAEAEIMFTNSIARAANGIESGYTETVVKQVSKPFTTKTTHPDGTVVEETFYKQITEKTEIERLSTDIDWRAASDWLKRRRPDDWKENVDVTSGGQAFQIIGIEVVKPPDPGEPDAGASGEDA